MTGWQKVAALTALYVVGLLWVNWTMVRRVRGAVAARAAWTAADFDVVFADLDPRVAPAVRTAIAPWYGEGVVPRPEDTLKRFLKMDRGDIDDLLADAATRLDLPPPGPSLPDLPDVAAVVRYLASAGTAPVRPAQPSVRPERVEARVSRAPDGVPGTGFDKLSTNGGDSRPGSATHPRP